MTTRRSRRAHPRLIDGNDEVAEPATVADTAPMGGEDAPPPDTAAANAEAALYPALPAEVALLDQALATPRPARDVTLREVGQRVLDAWDDDENQRTDLPTAIDALRTALATKPGRPAREAGAPRKPREGTKQETVLAMLRREEGATIAQICEATGWQQHTVRGFFAGLKKKGIEVTVLEGVLPGSNRRSLLPTARWTGVRSVPLQERRLFQYTRPLSRPAGMPRVKALMEIPENQASWSRAPMSSEPSLLL